MDEPYIPSDEPLPAIVDDRTLVYRGTRYYGKNGDWYDLRIVYIIFDEVCIRYGSVEYVFKRAPEGYVHMVVGESYSSALYELLNALAKDILFARKRGRDVSLARSRAHKKNVEMQDIKKKLDEPMRRARKTRTATEKRAEKLHPRLL